VRHTGYRGIVQLAATLACALIAGSSRSATPSEPIQPIPEAAAQDPQRVALGKRLFADVRLSRNAAISCASCHDLVHGGADARRHAVGFDGRPTEVSVPTVFNAALNFRQFWNGRAASLEDQVDEVVQSSIEMGSTWPQAVAAVARDEDYRRGFARAYADGVTGANIRNAIATFERTLQTPGARFDRYLRGDAGAITAQEKHGYAAFKQYGCVACHQGVNVGGNMFQKIGVMGDYFAWRGSPVRADLGRFLQTRQESDRHVFKVPGLRNVALTAPYFHDGSAQTLEEAVDVMFRFQLGRTASAADRADIVAFLKTLTGALAMTP